MIVILAAIAVAGFKSRSKTQKFLLPTVSDSGTTPGITPFASYVFVFVCQIHQVVVADRTTMWAW